MKRTAILLFALVLGACKQNLKKGTPQQNAHNATVEAEKKFPGELEKVFTAHGGLKTWQSKRTLSFDMPKGDFAEKHAIDLRSRKDRVDSEQFSLGFDGRQVWLLDTDKNYKGDPVFYHNLMFYFYTMPFVLADDGTKYSKADNLVFDGKHYPGIHISYEQGVGASSKDEYFIHYDPDTHQMAWLGYTVTYHFGEPSDNVRWIRYDNWQTVNGLVLPKSITWYNYEGTTILDPRSTVEFENVVLNGLTKPETFFEKPEGAAYVTQDQQ